MPSTRLFKSELIYTCTLVVNFGDLITKIYQSPTGHCTGGSLESVGESGSTGFCPLKDRALRFLRERAPSMPEEELIPCGWRVSMLGLGKVTQLTNRSRIVICAELGEQGIMSSSDSEPDCPKSTRGHDYGKHGLKHLPDGGTKHIYACACGTLRIETYDRNAKHASTRYGSETET